MFYRGRKTKEGKKSKKSILSFVQGIEEGEKLDGWMWRKEAKKGRIEPLAAVTTQTKERKQS